MINAFLAFSIKIHNIIIIQVIRLKTNEREA